MTAISSAKVKLLHEQTRWLRILKMVYAMGSTLCTRQGNGASHEIAGERGADILSIDNSVDPVQT